MEMTMGFQGPLRRDFLQLLGAGALGIALPGGQLRATPRSGPKTLRGIFPIASTPFTESDKLDLDALAAEVKFMDRGGVHGFVWPQNWSEWRTLTEQERFDGGEAILAAGKGARLALVIGVQGPDVATAVRYARHAEKLGADAVISLPPGENSDPATILEYYREVAKATDLPFFAQAVGNMTMDLLVEMYKAIPTFRYVKDEAAGSPLRRIIPLREKTSDQLKCFSGRGGLTLIDEMRRGSSGSMPTAAFPDLFAQTWDLWHDGKHQEAMDMQARTLLCTTESDAQAPAGAATPESAKYILYLRGVFQTSRLRRRPGQGFAPAAEAVSMEASLDAAGKSALRETLAYVKPYLRA